ncbi:DUF6461 domain-containing protein [Streptomyces sp. NPDC091972]
MRLPPAPDRRLVGPAHRLTGLRLTPELFATAEFRCGTVPRG